jgi:hypothetical protein
MLRWLSDKILELVSLIPAWLVEKDSLNFKLARGMFAVLLVVFTICMIAFMPSRATIARFIEKIFCHKTK